MKTLGVVGPGAATLRDRLVPRLDGRVATVVANAQSDTAADTPDGVAAAFELSPGGGWSGSGTDRDLRSLLDDLTPEYDHALLVGAPEAQMPTVTLGGADARKTVVSAANADAVDVAEVLDVVAGLEPRVTLESLVRRATESPRADRAGAIATFTGRVREKDADDDSPTTHLEFEKYEGVADERMATIRSDLTARKGVQEVLMHHRTGVVEAGEDIVFVVVLAGHREEAFRTVEDGINRLKDEVPLFKKERTLDEEFWVHDRN